MKKGDWVLIIIGIIIIATSIPDVKRNLDYLSKSKFANGTVINNAEEDFHNSHYAIPIVSFQSPDGQTRQFKSTMQYSPPKYQIGDQVEVIYDAADPSKAEINSPIDIWSGPGTTTIIGLAFISIGIFGQRKSKHFDKSPHQK